jgi:hypothetical protein
MFHSCRLVRYSTSRLQILITSDDRWFYDGSKGSILPFFEDDDNTNIHITRIDVLHLLSVYWISLLHSEHCFYSVKTSKCFIPIAIAWYVSFS